MNSSVGLEAFFERRAPREHNERIPQLTVGEAITAEERMRGGNTAEPDRILPEAVEILMEWPQRIAKGGAYGPICLPRHDSKIEAPYTEPSISATRGAFVEAFLKLSQTLQWLLFVEESAARYEQRNGRGRV